MASKSKQKSSKISRDTSRNRTKNHAIVEDDVIVEEVVPEEEEYSQMNFLSGRDEVSSAKLQEIYDKKFAPPRPKSDSSFRGSGARKRTIDLTSARKSATAHGDAFVRRRGDKLEEKKTEKEEQVDEVEVEKLVKEMKAAKVYEYDTELGIRTIEPRSDDSEDDDSSDDDSDESADEAENQNQNQGGSGAAEVEAVAAATMKNKKAVKKKKAKKPEADDDAGDIDPLFGKRGKCPLQLLSEFIDAVTKKEYASALNLCEMILIFEPTNEIALEFIPNLKEKIQIEKEQGSESEESSDDSDDSDDDASESGDTDDEF